MTMRSAPWDRLRGERRVRVAHRKCFRSALALDEILPRSLQYPAHTSSVNICAASKQVTLKAINA
ncbi:hypothetical protein WOLCODRAFT_135967 [Wolfiporia cocos MD-104 SS10]|uniref:Uncharacterized protein n=1 Tax=Wolfiporia cocos (strain MD-104) TaxID=742152 RepID=A0A2H3J7Q2_WOLCO|nr:hypothetical protein WOLCODRAFT_135967 [Wolfiporia cocos MD-104 SS10]